MPWAPEESAASELATIKTQATPKATDTETTVSKNPSGTDVDIRDQLDSPPSPSPEDEKPKEKSFCNPFDR
jgi:hypothetical protein